MAPGMSGLQKDVLALYRRALRMVNTKPPPTRPKFLLLVRYNFRINASAVSSRDVSAIEYLMRKGKRQLETYEDHGVKDCYVSGDMHKWDEMQKARRTLT